MFDWQIKTLMDETDEDNFDKLIVGFVKETL